MKSQRRPVRIANVSGFYGDRLSAAREILDGPRVDVLTGDWLAELTMSILSKDRARGGPGYAHTFVTQLREVLPRCLIDGIKVVSNAGGVAPQACADAIAEIATAAGLELRIAVIDGDDITARIGELRAVGETFSHLDRGTAWDGEPDSVLSATVYLGGHAVSAALAAGADVVVTGRLADAALVSGAAAWWHGWNPADLDQLAGATVAGHAIECGPQVTGGNFAFFGELESFSSPGFPIAEIAHDGTSIITKQPGAEGAVTVDTVRSQLLYEIGSARYPVPDVVVRLDGVEVKVADESVPNRVRISGARGEPAPMRSKAFLTYPGGYRNAMTLAVTGLDRRAKVEFALRSVWHQVPGGPSSFDRTEIEVVGASIDSTSASDQSFLRISVAGQDRKKVGRGFSSAVVATALGGYPGLYLTTPPTDASEFLVGWPTLIGGDIAQTRLTLDGCEIEVPRAHRDGFASSEPPTTVREVAAVGPSVSEVALGLLLGARSGDKGGNANLGVWVRDPSAYPWLVHWLTSERLADLMPEVVGLAVQRHLLPGMSAMNFVVVGLLGDGVAASLREDPQAKSLAERFRAVVTAVPAHLVTREVS